jgi:succinoglycan biosynthesis protein ExoO
VLNCRGALAGIGGYKVPRSGDIDPKGTKPGDVRVSVVIPAYTVEAFIAQTIDSVRRQTLQDLEILVVDDASPDQTASIVTRFSRADPRVHLIARPENGGVCLSRNDALQAARGRWVAFVDADDWLDPSRLAMLMEAGDRLGADWIADDQLIVAGPDQRPVGRVFHQEPDGVALIDLVHLIERDPPERIGYGTLKPLVRRSFLTNHEIRFRPGIERFEDFVFHVEVGLRGARMALLNRPLYFYRRHAGSLTAREPIATLDGMLKQNEVAIALAAGGCGAEGALTALRRREALIRHALQYRSLLVHLRRGDIRHAARTLREHPRAGLGLIGGVSRAVGRRLLPSL